MATKMISFRCPDCGASLEIAEDRVQGFCTYCGAKIQFRNENEYVVRSVDEADVKRAETEQMLELKRLELLEEMRKEQKKMKALEFKGSALIAIIAVGMILGGIIYNTFVNSSSWGFAVVMFGVLILMFLGLKWLHDRDEEKEAMEDLLHPGRVTIPTTVMNYEFKNYKTIESELKGAGFTDIKCVPQHVSQMDVLKRPNIVAAIHVNGKRISGAPEAFPKDAKITISYYSRS